MFYIATNGLYGTWCHCRNPTVWTLVLNPRQPIGCNKKYRSQSQSQSNPVNGPLQSYGYIVLIMQLFIFQIDLCLFTSDSIRCTREGVPDSASRDRSLPLHHTQCRLGHHGNHIYTQIHVVRRVRRDNNSTKWGGTYQLVCLDGKVISKKTKGFGTAIGGSGGRYGHMPPLGPISFFFHAVFRKISQKIGFCSHLCGIGTPFPSPNPVWEILDLPLISVLSNLSWYYICATYCLVQWNCCHCRFIEEILFCATSMVVNWRRQTGLGSWTCQTMFMTKTSKWENVSIGKEWEFLFPDFRTLILDT